MSNGAAILIPPEEIEQSLKIENPWWKTREIPKRFNDFPRRDYYQLFMKLVENKRVNRAVVLLGPRRVGKTVLATHCVQGLIESGVNPGQILYVSVDAPIYTNVPLDHFLSMFWRLNTVDPSSLYYVIFDEIQYLKGWERHLKTLVDRYPNARFIASGSAAAALKLSSTESGAGRFTEFMLPPLTFSEYLSFIGREDELIGPVPEDDRYFTSSDILALNKEFENYINYGGYPEAVLSQDVRSDAARYIKNDIIDKVLLRDLPQLYGIKDIQELNKLFTALAYQTGQEISLEKLSAGSGISKPTISKYIGYLEAAFLLFRVKRIDDKAKSFQRERTFKVHLTNPSMRAALFSPLSLDHASFGHLVETAVLCQWFHTGDTTENLYYARWKWSGSKKGNGDHGEIDIVHCPPRDFRPVWVVEIKWSDSAFKSNSDWLAIDEFCRRYSSSITNGTFTTRTQTKTTRRGGISFDIVPAALYCYTVGKNTVEGKTQGDAE